MRYFSLCLLALNVSIAVWCIVVGSWGWLFSLVGITVSVYMLIVDARYRTESERRIKRWAAEDKAFMERIARYERGDFS